MTDYDRLVKAALAPVVEEAPPAPPWENVVPAAPSRRRRRGGVVALAAASLTILLVGGGIMLLPSGDEPAPSVAPTVAPTGFDPAAPIPVTAAELGPTPDHAVELRPPLDDGRRLSPADFDADLTARLAGAASRELETADEPPPYGVVAVAERRGRLWAVLEHGDGGKGLLAVDPDGEVHSSAIGGRGRLSLVGYAAEGLPNFPDTEIAWVGLPAEVSYVLLETPGSGQGLTRAQAAAAGAVFFRITRPAWNQAGSMTAYDSSGAVVAVEDVELSGARCSGASVERPEVVFADVPEPVTAAIRRLASLGHRCGAVELGRLATGPGPYFGVDGADLGSELRGLDKSWPVLRHLALLPAADVTGTGPYTFTGPRLEVVIDTDGTWLSASGD